MPTAKQYPLVSVIMPVFNAQEFVGTAIESILKQTYPNFELVVVDDASTDTSWQIIQQYAKKYPRRVKPLHLRNNVNGGGDHAANRGYARSYGDYIARMDADDIAEPTRLAKQVAFLEANLNITAVGSQVMVINEKNQVVGEKHVPTEPEQISRQFFSVHPMIHPTIMLRRADLASQTKLYKAELNSNNDYHTFFWMVAEGKRFANLPEKLLRYRVHSSNDSLSNLKRTFQNTFITRMQVLRGTDYKPTVAGYLSFAAQWLITQVLPEKIMRELYLRLRGMHTHSFRLS